MDVGIKDVFYILEEKRAAVCRLFAALHRYIRVVELLLKHFEQSQPFERFPWDYQLLKGNDAKNLRHERAFNTFELDIGLQFYTGDQWWRALQSCQFHSLRRGVWETSSLITSSALRGNWIWSILLFPGFSQMLTYHIRLFWILQSRMYNNIMSLMYCNGWQKWKFGIFQWKEWKSIQVWIQENLTSSFIGWNGTGWQTGMQIWVLLLI